MVNEEKIRLMTKAAAFESGEGKKALEMNRFFQKRLHQPAPDRRMGLLHGGFYPVRGSLGFL